MTTLRDILSPSRLTSIVDVGANPIDSHPPYRRMLEEGLCEVMGFDPQMSASPSPGVRYLPHVVGSGDPATLYVCEAPGMTSLLQPDPVRTRAFPGFLEWSQVTEQRPVATARLDDLDIHHMDMLCLDIQGSETEVLRSGPAKIRGAVAVLTEVSFIPLYRGQPTFGDVDNLMRRFGFIPHCFAGAKVWPIATNTQLQQHDPHQLLEADIVYVRDWISGGLTPDQWRHLALLAHHCFGSFDLAMRCVEALAEMEQITPEGPALYRQLLGVS